MSERTSEYGVIVKNVLLTEVTSKNANNPRTVLLGTIVKIETILGGKNLCVRFLKDGETWESTTFLCSRDDMVFIEEKLWPYLAAVVSPQERTKLAKNKDKCNKLLQVAKDMTVGFADYNDVYLGTVKFIGNVKGMGKCFGIQLHVSII